MVHLKGLPTVHEPAESLLRHVFRNFGLPENVVSGSSQQFILLVYAVKEIFDSLCHRGYFKYLTDWEVYGPEERSWVTQNDNLESTLLTSFQVEHLTCPAVCICISSHSRSRAAQILNSVTQSVSGFHQGHLNSFPSRQSYIRVDSCFPVCLFSSV